MRRALPALALALVLLAGCGSSQPQRKSQATPEGGYGHPVKVIHAAGQTFVPARSRRVVALTTAALDTSLALGVRPVGVATDPRGRLPAYLSRRVGDVTNLGPPARVDIDTVDALDPELVLGSRASQGGVYNRLRFVAPTVLTSESPHDWQLRVRLEAETLGRVDQAERKLERYDATALRARRALRSLRGASVAVLRLLPDQTQVAGAGSFAAALVVDAGLRPAASLRRGGITGAFSGTRALGSPDLTLVSVARGAGPRWAALRPRLRGRVVRVDDGAWWSGGGLLAARSALAGLETLSRRG